MGQTVIINSVVAMGETLLIDTDRSFTGQDGMVMTPDQPGHAVPGKLARRLFELHPGIDHVYVLQNTVSVRRAGGWDEERVNQAKSVVEDFLRFY